MGRTGYRDFVMVLSDRSIKEAIAQGRIIIDPLGEDCVQPSSVDLHIDQFFRVFRNHTQRVIDVRDAQEDLTELIDVGPELPMILHPVSSCSAPPPSASRFPTTSSDGSTERVRSVASVSSSTRGRFVDAGWDGHITLELSNVANLPITLYPGMKIGQISFFQMTTPADRPYGSEGLGSKYSGQRGPTPSRYSENFKKQ